MTAGALTLLVGLVMAGAALGGMIFAGSAGTDDPQAVAMICGAIVGFGLALGAIGREMMRRSR